MFIAKEVKKTSKGNTYMILQDSPSTFHISVTIGSFVSYDFIESPSNVETIYTRIEELETELETNINTIQTMTATIESTLSKI